MTMIVMIGFRSVARVAVLSYGTSGYLSRPTSSQLKMVHWNQPGFQKNRGC